MVSFRYPYIAACALLHVGWLHAALAQHVSCEQIVQQLQDLLSSDSEIILTSNPAYTEDFTARFSGTHAPQYVVGVKPALIGDVQSVVEYASSHDVAFMATGGGHGYTWSIGRLQNAIDLDMGNFQSIDVDVDRNTMTIGGATRIGNVTEELYTLGKEFPVGMCPTVGMTGLTLGGGVGPLGGFYGTASDNLKSIEMVTGNGEILNVSATSHPNLFYGMKGAGFNYGVVTSLTYQVHPATNNGLITVINAMFPGSLNGSVFGAANSFVGKQPKELAILFSIHFNETMGGMMFWGSFVYFGQQQEALEAVKPFLDLNPLYVEVNTASYHNFSTVALYGDVADVGQDKSIDFAPYTLNLYQVNVSHFISIFNHMNDTLSTNEGLQSATLSWAQYSLDGFLEYPLDSSAFAYRDVVVWFSYDGFTTNATLVPALDQFGQSMRSLVQQGSGRPDLETYVHFSHGDEGPQAWYSAGKLPKLLDLKARYDPADLFSWYNPVTGI